MTANLPGIGSPCPTLCVHGLLAVVTAVVHEIDGARAREHRAHAHLGPCDVSLVVAGRQLLVRGRRRAATWSVSSTTPCDCETVRPTLETSQLFRLDGECPCRDLVVATLDYAHRYVAGQWASLVNPPAAARRHVRVRQHDHVRDQRLERGAQARVDRLPGGVLGKELGTTTQRWLLQDVADEAGSGAPLVSERQLLERLGARRCRRTGETATAVRPEVARDFATVRDVCRRSRRVNVGTRDEPDHVSWWDAFVERPLGRRPTTGSLSFDDGDVVERHHPNMVAVRQEDDVLRILRDTVERGAELAGADLVDAFLKRIRAEGLLPDHLRQRYVAEARRIDAAQVAMTELVTAHRNVSPLMARAA